LYYLLLYPYYDIPSMKTMQFSYLWMVIFWARHFYESHGRGHYHLRLQVSPLAWEWKALHLQYQQKTTLEDKHNLLTHVQILVDPPETYMPISKISSNLFTTQQFRLDKKLNLKYFNTSKTAKQQRDIELIQEAVTDIWHFCSACGTPQVWIVLWTNGFH